MSELLKSHNGDYFKSDSGKIVEIDECTYLRADTCTPNEECVSKARLEKEIQWHESQSVHYRQCGNKSPCTPNLNYIKAQMHEESAKRLREVMDK